MDMEFGKGIVAIIAITGAVYLRSNDKDGWGWLIFVAICCL